MKHFAVFHLGVGHFFLIHGCVHMGQMDFIINILLFFFSKLFGK